MGLQIVKLLDPIQLTISGTFTPKGAYDNATDYAVGDQVSYNGSSYIMYVNAAAGTLPTDNTKWGLLASKGDTGATGSTGATGAAGADGNDGAPGATGDTGAPGADGEDGASAYEIAVANGFVGDELAWLASLVGEQGEQGEQGIQGIQGVPGNDGADGADGVMQSVVAGTNITVDATDPANPIISATGGGDSLPDQTGNGGKFLLTDGTDEIWANVQVTDVLDLETYLEGKVNVSDLPVSNYEAETDPTADDDENDGYNVGSRWVNTLTETEFVCVNKDAGSAVWVETTSVGGGGGGISDMLLANRQTPYYFWDYHLAGVATANFPSTALTSGTAAYLNNVAGHPGVLSISSSTSNNSGIHSYLFNSQVMKYLEGGEIYECGFMIPSTVNTGAFTVRMGMMDTTTSNDAADGVYFQMSNSMNINAKTAAGATRTNDLIATLTTDTWYRARIEVNSGATSAAFTIYDSSGAVVVTTNITTNLPTANTNLFGFGFIATGATSSVLNIAQVDYQSIKMGSSDQYENR